MSTIFRRRTHARPFRHVRIAPRRAALVAAVVALGSTTVSCVPGTPHIDGVAGAPDSPATPWPVPAAARMPPPPPSPPTSPAATAALHADSAASAAVIQLSMTDVVDLALRSNPATRESWALAR